MASTRIIRRHRRRAAATQPAAALLLCAVATLTGCGVSIPTDPHATLEGIEGGVLRAGYSPEPGLIEAGSPAPSGPLAELVADYAATEDATVTWTDRKSVV